ncbi:MAG: hypothetical protein HPY83_05460 [Anaerolineae bacterium]|nr:hypothetical protein [Anaerolineae bacterium]
MQKRTLLISLTEKELQEVIRILLDKDEEAALEFVDKHVKPAVHRVLDGG